MPRSKTAVAIASLLALILTGEDARADQTLIAPGAVWKYNDSGTNLGTAWRVAAYVDTSWASGAAQLGYGDGDESTVLSFGSSTNRRITYYFRRSFTVTAPAQVAALSLRHVRDDGSVLYLNGVEVARSNMPTGTVTYTTRASSSVSGSAESAWIQSSVDPSLLVAGTNVLAAEVHQQSPTSTDVSFDLELIATDAQVPAPTVSLLAPAHQSASNTAAVTFSASASAPAGLASATLLVGDPPQTLVFSGPLQVEDAQIAADTPTTPAGSAASISVDGQSPHAHGLMKFPTLVGGGGGQVPAGSAISSAVLRLDCTNSGNLMRLYRLTQAWVEDEATWNQRSTGVAWTSLGADGAGSNAGVALSGDCTATGQRSIDVTTFVQEWSDGASNHGLVLVDSGTDGVAFGSSESATGSPVLTVVYRNAPQALGTQSLSGTSSPVSFSATLATGRTYGWNVRVTDVEGRQALAPSDFELTVDGAVPDAPASPSPADGATDVAAQAALEAFVSDPGGGPLDVRFELRPAAAPEFTIIALPDTQHYSEAFPAIFTSQTQWIVDNKDARNIVFVTHEGDLVEHNSLASEWMAANTSMSLLDGVVPYGMGPGNHDQPTTLYNQYFPYTRYQGEPWYGGHLGNLNDNNFQLFSGGGMDFVIVHLEFCPSSAAVTWADSVYKSYPDRIGIFTTHGYLGATAQRSVHLCTNTEYLWSGLALTNPNLRFMLSGHVHAESRRTDTVDGRDVFQMLADYQDRAQGGEGWLRILRFVPAENTVYVQTYSPWLGRYETDADSEFTLSFAMGGAFENVGTGTVPSGSRAAIVPSGLAPGTRYEWRMTVTNVQGKSRTGPVWTFTTAAGGPVNQPPVASGQSVTVVEDTPALVTLSATDPDGDPLTYTIVTAPTRGTLTGTAPSLTYRPNDNYAGSDSFTFRANDGQANSNPATVTLTVQAVNDVPVATGESYSVQGGTTLTVNTPGVLANDTDVEGNALVAQLASGPTHGSLTLNANGSFTYTPSPGYVGPDAFTYAASDGVASSTAATVNVTVTAAPPPVSVTVFAANFNSGTDSFTYADNRFRGTTQSAYASGSRVATDGFSGGGLLVLLGGLDNATINGMSGGWSRSFTLSAAATLKLSFRCILDQTADYESDEVSQALASLDGVLKAIPPSDSLAQIAGDGDGGAVVTTGWQLFEISLGIVPAGTHTLTLGGYNNKKDGATERSGIRFDDVSLQTVP